MNAPQVLEACHRRVGQPTYLPENPKDEAMDRALASSCVAVALHRHCGKLRMLHRRNGSPVQRVDDGPDLRETQLVIGSGGVLVHDKNGAETICGALTRRRERSLTPTSPTVLIDRNYIMAAAGLLSTIDMDLAGKFLASEFSD